MAEHYHQTRSESLRRELDAADLRRRDDIACDSDDEQVAHTLIEHELHRHPRIGASEDHGKRLLAIDEILPSRLAEQGLQAANPGREPSVSFTQPLQCLLSRQHCTSPSMIRCRHVVRLEYAR